MKGSGCIPQLNNRVHRNGSRPLTRQIAESLHEALKPKAIVVKIKASHLCMMMRGVEKQNSYTITECDLGTNKLTEKELERLYQSIDL